MEFDEVERLVGTETARRFRLLGADLKGDSLDRPSTAAGDGRDGEERAVDSEDSEDGDR